MGKKNELNLDVSQVERFKIRGRKYTVDCYWGVFLSWLPRVISIWGGNETIFDIAEEYTPAFKRIVEREYFDILGSTGITNATAKTFLDFLIKTGLIKITGEKPTQYGIRKMLALAQLILDMINSYVNAYSD